MIRAFAVAVLGVLPGLLISATPIDRQQPPGDQMLAMQQAGAGPRSLIKVESSAFKHGAAMSDVHSDYGQKVSPPLEWSDVPSAVKSLVLIVEDPDAVSPRPFVHWIAYNISPELPGLPMAVPPTPRLKDLDGVLQGRTSKGTIGYYGPHPPAGDPPHHYHFQIFGLDVVPALDPNADRETVLDAMKGHVVAAGELVGTYQADVPARGRALLRR